MVRKVLLSFSVCLVSIASFAQLGTIKGNIKDATSGEAIIGANIFLAGTAQGVAADVNGDFEIQKVKAGTHTLIISFISYKTDTLKDVTVYPDQTTAINHKMVEESQTLTEVVVSGTRVTNTDFAVITEIRKNDLIAVGISSQQITMSQDRDAAQVLKRLPGVTIVNNRFINVRGLSERYSTVMLNGIIAPSSEVDSKAFAFDMIPSNMLDRMLVYKSGSPELPGEFAGADVNIFTKSVVDENAISLSVSGSFRANTTGEDVVLGQEKSNTDWLGKDSGIRELPGNFPSTNLRNLSLSNPLQQNQLVNASRMLPNTWGTRSFSAAPDFRVNLDLSRSIPIGSMKLDNITSLSYAQTNQRLELTQNYYDVFSEANQASTPRYQYNDVRFTQTNRIGAISNFTFMINPLHRIEFRNFYNQQGQNQSTLRTGTENATGYDVKNQALSYFSRSIYSGQLSGKHGLSDAVNFTWIFGYNNTTAEQPDYRRIRSQRSIGTEEAFSIVIPPSASSFDAGRFYSKLNEQTYSAAGNLEIKLNPQVDADKQSKIIAGYYLEQKDRDFSARWFSNKWMNTNEIDNSLLLTSFDQIFVPQNMGTKFILEEGTNVGGGADPSTGSYDRYDGYNRLIAGYAGIVTPFAERFKVNAGIRVENNVQKIYVYNEAGNKINVTNSPLTVPMPFVNLTYNITENMLMRVAYSKTVNRPVFRELAPFNFYDFDRNADVSGNKDLKTAKIDNIDLFWELYPTKAEKISFGVFYKNFKDPIEQVLRPGSNLIYNYENADKATTYGVEAEVRKSLENLSSPFLRKLTFVFNGALIHSKIELPERLDNLDHDRAMQGQSPYVANASVYYNNEDNGLQVSVQYNIFGKRIYAVGDKDANATQYEMPRNQLDFTLSKRLTQHFDLKFGVQDILNQKYRLIQDSNRDKKITNVDESIQSFRWGQYATLGVVWKL